ncbi:MAG: LicD family protein [Maribacter sp.]
MAYDITLEGENLVQAEKLLSEVTTIFESCKIAYWLEGGTLLGLRREGRLLPWDNDLDISIHESESNKISLLQNTLKKEGYRVRTRVFEKDSDAYKKGDLRMIKIRTKRFFGLLKGNVCLDVFIKYTKNEKTYWEIANKVKNVPSKYYETFKTLDFKGKPYAIPELTDEYLSYRYGDWQTAVKDWDTSKDDRALS